MSASKLPEKDDFSQPTVDDVSTGDTATITAGSQALHRKLRSKEVQLFAIGGAIGTCKLSDNFGPV